MLAFWIAFGVMTFLIVFFDRKYNMLRDLSKAHPQPYSWSRVQLAWWTVIVLSAFTAIIIERGEAPNLHYSTLVLLSISMATTATARVIDVSDEQNPAIFRHQDQTGTNFFLDILSDQSGPSIHRFQTLVFNAVFGVWFISTVNKALGTGVSVDDIIPVVTENNLILLGMSSAAYAALKTTENKSDPRTQAPTPAEVPDESVNSSIAQG